MKRKFHKSQKFPLYLTDPSGLTRVTRLQLFIWGHQVRRRLACVVRRQVETGQVAKKKKKKKSAHSTHASREMSLRMRS